MNYRLFLALTSAVAATEAEAQKATPERPNVIFILADDMGYGDLSCFGSKHVKTPNIDRLSETGTPLPSVMPVVVFQVPRAVR